MRLIADVMERLRMLVFRRREERELAEEFEHHFEREVSERLRRGEAPDEARHHAALAFGGTARYAEQVRDARGTRPLEDLAADIRYAARGLRRSPGFTITALLVLSLGIGATTTVYGIMHAVVLADLPYPEPGRLVRVFEQNAPTNRWSLSVADVTAIREQQRVFEAWGVVQRGVAALTGSGAPERVLIGRATAGFFAALRVPMVAGRPIETRDESPAAAPVVVVSQALALRQFGDTRSALDRSVSLDGVPHTVVGVLPAGHGDLAGVSADAWPVFRMNPPTRRGPFGLVGIGRLRPGLSREAAADDLARVSANLLPLWSDFRDSTAKLTPYPLREVIIGGAGRQVGLFAAGVGLVLLLAIVNVATLVLVRASAREPELAVRLMLGARPGRLTRLLATENLLLTVVAGAIGLSLAIAGIGAAVGQLTLPRIATATLDWRVAAFGLGISFAAGVLVSLTPIATLTGRGALAPHVRGRREGAGRRTNRLRSAFVGAEFALAWPLLVVAGLLSASFLRLQRVDPGFDPDGLVAVAATLPPTRYPTANDVRDFWTRVEQRVSSLPGVSSVGLATQIPPDRSGNTDNFNLESRPVPTGQAEHVSPWYYVTPDYFTVLGIRVVQGRAFSASDTSGAPAVVMVSRTWARRYFGTEAVVGEQLVQGGCYACPRTTIIGVLDDIRNLGPSEPGEAVYGSLSQLAPRTMFVMARSARPEAQAIADLADALTALDPSLPVTTTTVADRLAASFADPRRWAAVLTAFSVVGLVLAAVGIYGLVAYTVRQRHREIGIRIALGADPATVTRLMVLRGIRLALAGSLVGVFLAGVVAGRLRALLFGIDATDPATFGTVGTLLLGTAFLAAWLPARRAAQVRPVEAIASE